MITSQKIKISLTVLVLLGAAYEFSTFSLLSGLSGPVGSGGLLIIASLYLIIAIAVLISAFYLASISKIA